MYDLRALRRQRSPSEIEQHAARIRELSALRMTQTEIAKRLGVSVSTVAREQARIASRARHKNRKVEDRAV